MSGGSHAADSRAVLGHGRIKENGNLSAGGLFLIESEGSDAEGGPPPMWRPDLLPAIMAWIAQVPACDWRLFVGFGSTTRGGFEAHFVVPDRSANMREVTIRFDHNSYQCLNEICGVDVPRIIDFHPSHLYGTANLRLSTESPL